jgi:hypothetical protein
VLSNFVLVIAAALSGFIVQLHFELRTLLLSVLIVVIGCYGRWRPRSITSGLTTTCTGPGH